MFSRMQVRTQLDLLFPCVKLTTGENCTALVFGQSRVAPVQVTSIPRLELCATALAA